MGFLGIMTTWQRQTCFFGHDQGEARDDGAKARRDTYSVLIFDNRGVGISGRPLMRYSTSEMARDTLELVNAIGWTGPRQLHLIGISLGGMIAQELACVAPQRLASLNLICTSARLPRGPSVLVSFAKRVAFAMLPLPQEDALRRVAVSVFPMEWLLAPDEDDLPSPASTPGCDPPGSLAPGQDSCAEYGHFDSNFQRFQAQTLTNRLNPAFAPPRIMCQGIAAGWHCKTDEQLRAMADAVGRERILVLHGTLDAMIGVEHGRRLIDVLKPADGLIVEGLGHGPIMQRPKWFNQVLERKISLCSRL
ncbi:hypothetical protein CDD82_5698 [Ophiocordyceps australis]|uniref:Uncharacterized protein n=1 Tax=Ophiocordyceps australis TaxID=1399860 RepID=A0A2C5Z054_9HYPO|nr:hypothetical protein CDD82_5698 [Ophiocordyceps australis]